MKTRIVVVLIGALALAAAAVGVGQAGATPSAPAAVRSAGSTSRPTPPPRRGSFGVSAVPAALPAGSRVIDTVVANTDASLKNTDTYADWEPSIAVDPANANHIVITAFSSCWQVCDAQANAALWTSVDGGKHWTKSRSVPPPPNVAIGSGCPCDQTPDYGRSSRLYATFLDDLPSPPGEIYTGSSTNPAKASAWAWQTTSGIANPTNAASTDGDQPQLVTGPNPTNPTHDNVYVGYDDLAPSTPTVHVAVNTGPLGARPATDHQIGLSSACCINPGLRLATDHKSGALYAVWEQATYNSARSPRILIQYMLNRSTNGGKTWSLNGHSTGIQLASVPSDQIYDSFTANPMKFGTVNALFGGIDTVAVDPTTGDVYVAFGRRDTSSSKNRLAVIRLRKTSAGGLSAGTPMYATGQCQCALPSIAIASSGEIGLLYDSFDGFDGGGFPKFSAHLGESVNRGATFSNVLLSSWSSVVTDNGNTHQRVLGDYQQLKTTGMAFYGTFTANGLGLGRPFADTDAIFFEVPASPSISSVQPKTLARGATNQTVMIHGSGFQTGARVNFANSGAKVVGSATVTPNEITIRVSISHSASTGKTNVAVSNLNGGKTTCAKCFTVT